jgi:hypothetical protein
MRVRFAIGGAWAATAARITTFAFSASVAVIASPMAMTITFDDIPITTNLELFGLPSVY